MNDILANIIFLFHTMIILFVLFAPFINIPSILILHITFCICLLLHWYQNSNVCSLTLLEAKLRNIDHPSKSFTHQFIAPMYDISNTEWSKICYIVTIIVMSISIYNLKKSNKFNKFLEDIKNIEFNENDTLKYKISKYLDVTSNLFF